MERAAACTRHEGQRVEGGGQRERREGRTPHEVCHDHRRAAADAVHQDPDEQSQHRVGGGGDRVEDADLGVADVQDHHGDRRQDEGRHLIADERHRLPGPQPPEVPPGVGRAHLGDRYAACW
jgi:hypothetical protein